MGYLLKKRSQTIKIVTKLTKKPRILQRLTGLNMNQFKKLSKSIKPLWKKSEKDRLNKRERIRKVGAGRRYHLESIEEKLALILIYYRTYAVQDLLAYMFCIDQSNVSRLIKKLEPLIERAASPNLKGFLNNLKKAHDQLKPIGWDEFVRIYPDAEGFITDATEVRCFRPKDKEKQKRYYSGKKKTHSLKTQITISKSTQRILNVSETFAGSMHDKKVFDTTKIVDDICPQVPHWMDLGYLGVQTDHHNFNNILPIKKNRKQLLPEFAKEINKAHSKRRILVEHILSRIKKFSIIGHLYRGGISRFNQVFRNICAIHNFKIGEPIAIS